MKKTIVFTMILLLVAGISFAKDYEVKKKAGEFDIVMKIDKNPPVAGENNISLEIKDPSGKPVTDATVKVDYGMSAMPGMPAMNYKADAVMKGGEYKAAMNLSMSGPWSIAVKIVRAGKTSSAKFSIDAR